LQPLEKGTTIGELPGRALHLYTVKIAGGDQPLRGLMACQTTGGACLTPFVVGMPDIPGCYTHQNEGRDHKDEIEGIKEKHISLPFKRTIKQG
jgi:hypothetical protein